MIMDVGKSKICRANVPVWVKRSEAIVELGEANVLVQSSSGRRSQWSKTIRQKNS